jgi:hypothetical protein
MIEAIGRQPSEMTELRNNRQELSVDSGFAAAFRGATRASQASIELPDTAAPAGTLQKAVDAGASALSSGTGLMQVVNVVAPVSTGTTPAAAPVGAAAPVSPATASPAGLSNEAPDTAGWTGPPNQPGSSYNPVTAWGQVPGQQPPWISGNYPGATWTAVNDAGFLMPYSSLSPGPGEDLLSGANENVVDQDWAKYYDQVDGTQAGNQVAWGANNPTDQVAAPWLNSSNTDPQYTASNPLDLNQPTQPNFVVPPQVAT